MFFSQHRLVLGAAVVSESAWVFSILGAVGLASGLGGSPVSWTAVLGVLGVSVVVARSGPSKVAAAEVVYLVRTLVWVAVAYAVIGSQASPDSAGIDLGWVFTAVSGSAPEGYTVRAIEASVVVVLLVLRGARLAAVPDPVDSLSIGFRIGLLALTLAVTIDLLHPADLHVFPTVFVFFATGLGGLSIGHLMPESQESAEARTWPRVITGIVSAVLVVGLLFSLVPRGLSSVVSAPLEAALGIVGQAVFWVIVVPISLVFNTLDYLVTLVFSRDVDFAEFASQASPRGFQSVTSTGEEIIPEFTDELIRQPEEAEAGVELFAILNQALVIFFMVVLAVVVFLVLSKALRRFSGSVTGSRGEPESLSREARPASDVAGLLFRLLPEWLKRRRRRTGPRLPDGPPGVVNALRIYYQLLVLAEEKGIGRRSHETAAEFQKALEGLFPRNLVRLATEAFNRACYGNYPATDQQIAQMRASLASIKSAIWSIGRRGRGLRTHEPGINL